jgi:hypothetical protein
MMLECNDFTYTLEQDTQIMVSFKFLAMVHRINCVKNFIAGLWWRIKVYHLCITLSHLIIDMNRLLSCHWWRFKCVITTPLMFHSSRRSRGHMAFLSQSCQRLGSHRDGNHFWCTLPCAKTHSGVDYERAARSLIHRLRGANLRAATHQLDHDVYIVSFNYHTSCPRKFHEWVWWSKGKFTQVAILMLTGHLLSKMWIEVSWIRTNSWKTIYITRHLRARDGS